MLAHMEEVAINFIQTDVDGLLASYLTQERTHKRIASADF